MPSPAVVEAFSGGLGKLRQNLTAAPPPQRAVEDSVIRGTLVIVSVDMPLTVASDFNVM